MKKLLAVLFLISFSSNIFSSQALAQETAANKVKIENAGNFVDDIGNKIIKVAGEKISEEKKKDKIIAIIDKVIDAEWIARFVLGKSYKIVNDTQKQSFTKLYREFMINTYGPKFKNYNGRKFTVLKVTEQKGFYVAKSEFLPRDSNMPVSVDFRVKERDGKFVILDFIAEGVSLIETQRSEFNSTISEKGMDQFLMDLKARVERLKKGN